MKKKFSLLGVALVLSVVALSCGDSSSDTTTTSDDVAATTVAATSAAPVTVKVATLPFITFAPYYIGIEEGYFAEQGIEVELVDFAVAEEILPALSSGQVDVSGGLVSAGMFNAISRGADIKLTADKGNIEPGSCTNFSLIGRKSLIEAGALDSPSQLAGLTINAVPTTWLEYYLWEVLREGDLTLDDITQENLASPAVAEAMNQEALDVAAFAEPFVTFLAADGHVPVLDLPQDILPNATAAVMLYGPALLGDNRDAGTRFMAGYLKSVAQYAEGKIERNIDIVEAFTQLPRGVLETMCWPSLKVGGEINVDSIMDFQTYALERGYIDTIVPADQVYDESFIDAAQALLDG